MRLEGKVALITGAATGERDGLQGIGGATAWAFIREGARVVVTDIDDELGNRTVVQMNEDGGEAFYLHLDVREEAEWVAAIEATIARFGRLDILVNNAGYGTKEGLLPIEETPVDVFDDYVSVNARGTFLGTKHAVPHLRKAGGGSIVNISSIDGIIGETVTIASYQAGKGAIRIFTKAAAIELAKDNIRVNSVHPGYTTTPAGRKSSISQEVFDHLLSKVPLGRRALANEIANGVLYLGSDDSSYVTGAELIIDGGVTAQ